MNVPTFFTFLNLFSGFMAIISISEGRADSAFWFVVFSAVFDFLDGKMARILKTQSKLGPQIDSLADAVSFGVAPAFFVYNIVFFQVGRFSPFYIFPFVYLSAVITRLARFNMIGEDSQKEFYYGLSSPMSAMFMVSFALTFGKHLPYFVFMKEAVGAVVILLSFLMLSKIEFPVFKSKEKSEKIQILFFVLALVALVIFKSLFLMVSIGLYIILGVLFFVFRKESDEKA
ncbi:MAG: CDP-diacylglycerol--serine O-phosphatidyltransferase [candidate division WOR-3 bacterium]